MVLPQEVSGFARTVPMALVPAGSAPAIEPTSSRPLESICSDSVLPLVTVGRVELNDPPIRVTEPGCAAARAPTEAFDPPPPDCCIWACVLFHTLPSTTTAVRTISRRTLGKTTFSPAHTASIRTPFIAVLL